MHVMEEFKLLCSMCILQREHPDECAEISLRLIFCILIWLGPCQEVRWKGSSLEGCQGSEGRKFEEEVKEDTHVSDFPSTANTQEAERPQVPTKECAWQEQA